MNFSVANPKKIPYVNLELTLKMFCLKFRYYLIQKIKLTFQQKRLLKNICI